MFEALCRDETPPFSSHSASPPRRPLSCFYSHYSPPPHLFTSTKQVGSRSLRARRPRRLLGPGDRIGQHGAHALWRRPASSPYATSRALCCCTASSRRRNRAPQTRLALPKACSSQFHFGLLCTSVVAARGVASAHCSTLNLWSSYGT